MPLAEANGNEREGWQNVSLRCSFGLIVFPFAINIPLRCSLTTGLQGPGGTVWENPAPGWYSGIVTG